MSFDGLLDLGIHFGIHSNIGNNELHIEENYRLMNKPIQIGYFNKRTDTKSLLKQIQSRNHVFKKLKTIIVDV